MSRCQRGNYSEKVPCIFFPLIYRCMKISQRRLSFHPDPFSMLTILFSSINKKRNESLRVSNNNCKQRPNPFNSNRMVCVTRLIKMVHVRLFALHTKPKPKGLKTNDLLVPHKYANRVNRNRASQFI